MIRPATVDDAYGIARVHVTTWQDAYRGIVPNEYLDALDIDARVEAYDRMGVLTDTDRPMFVYDRSGDILGFVTVGPSIDEKGNGELYAIYVASKHWGTPVGAALMTHGDQWLGERYPAATLWVLDENARARRFYEKHGWFADGTTKDDDRGSFVLHEVRYRRNY
ncbi:MAG TPA: GNAT family N-acetyltransferase [Actinomycetota bacterium]|jgi:ribosomal protein S18 acetylase RimI-like enzyme|nr:GNAT family N-acetyltransferase [Actinomycetota bacterium]